MKEEILTGLRNAMERGSSLEEAAKSLTNAGYSEIEVKEASSSLTLGATSITSPQKEQEKPKERSFFFKHKEKPKPEDKKQFPTNQNNKQEQLVSKEQNMNSWEPVSENNDEGTGSELMAEENNKLPEIDQAQQAKIHQIAKMHKQHSNLGKVFLVLIPILLILIGGIIAMLIFKDRVIDFIKNIF